MNEHGDKPRDRAESAVVAVYVLDSRGAAEALAAGRLPERRRRAETADGPDAERA